MRIHEKTIIDIRSGQVLADTKHEAIGAIARAKGGQSSTNTVTMPQWAVPYATKFLNSYEDQVYDPVTGQPKAMPDDLNMQLAGFTPEQEAAMGGMTGITPATMGLAGAGGMNAMGTLSGQYLTPDSNPYLSGMYDAASRKMTDAYSTATAPSIMAAAQRAGQFGGSAMDEALAMSRYDLGENLGNLANTMYGGAYATERGNQMNALNMLPNTIGAMYQPYQNLMGVGALKQEQEQAGMDTGYQNAVTRTEWPFNLLSGMGSAITQAVGGGGTSRTQSSGGGGMFGSVICTTLNKFGLMDDETYAADSKFGESLPREVIAGYHFWAIPLAKAMHKSYILTALIEPIAMSWARTMRAKVEGKPENETWLGLQLLRFGVPICGLIGRMVNAAKHYAVQG